MTIHHAERRQEIIILDRGTWRLWALIFSVTICLALAIAAFFYPAMRWHVDRLEILNGILPQLILGLITLVLLCIVYIVFKQRELNDLRNFLIAITFETGQLSAELSRDPLTGVLDRSALPDVFKRETTWVDRYHIPLSLVLFNIRGFRKINQAIGNLAADLVLKDLAIALQVTSRQTDTVVRYGPDQFLCFLPRTDPKGAEAFGRRVFNACRQNPPLRDLSLSFGVAVYHSGGNSEKLLAEVERDLSEKDASAAPAHSTSSAQVQSR